MAQVKSAKFAVAKLNKGDGTGVFLVDKLTVATNPVANDTLDFVIPKGIEVTGIKFNHTALAASGLAGKVGFASLTGAATVKANGTDLATDDDYFRAAGTFGLTATGFDCYFPPITFGEDVLLRLTVTVTATSFAAGSLWSVIEGGQVGVK